MYELIGDLKKLKELVAAKDWWAVAEFAPDLAKKVVSFWKQFADSGLFFSGNPEELDKAISEVEAELKPTFGAPDDPKAIDPTTVITLVTFVLDLIKKWLNRK